MLVPPAYLAGDRAVRRRPLRLWRFELPVPSPAIAAGQVLLSAVEWALAGAVLYVLLPPSALPFLRFLGTFLVAILLGHGQPRARRPGRVRRADGPAAQAVPHVRAAAAGACRVSRGVLPAAADRSRSSGSSPTRSGSAARPRRASGAVARPAHGAADAARAGRRSRFSRAWCCSSRAPRRPRPGGWRCSIASCRSA